MTIPRQIGPETGPRTVLPDYSRSAATVERMVASLRPRAERADGPGGPAGDRRLRVLFPAAATADTLLRSVVSALCLGSALIAGTALLLVVLGVEDGHAPGLGRLLVMGALGVLALLTLLLGVRFGVVALGTARSRVEVTEEGLVVVGAFGARRVSWQQIVAVESRVTDPVHWLTAALRLHDGTRVVMPAFDRHIWTYSRPTGQGVRTLRSELHRREHAARARR